MRDVSYRSKPCPMCGCKTIIVPDVKPSALYDVKIRCARCGLTGIRTFDGDTPYTEALNKVIKYWNTRANDSPRTIDDILTKIGNEIDVEVVTDSSGDTNSYISQYDKGLQRAYDIVNSSRGDI